MELAALLELVGRLSKQTFIALPADALSAENRGWRNSSVFLMAIRSPAWPKFLLETRLFRLIVCYTFCSRPWDKGDWIDLVPGEIYHLPQVGKSFRDLVDYFYLGQHAH